LKLDILV